ncbi:MAG: hypothetical protein AB1500_09400 [Bacillota bacterium]
MFNKKLLITTTVIILIFLCASCEQLKHGEGRDTVMSFGDGTYQFFRNDIYLQLFNVEKFVTIELKAKTWRLKDNKLYIYGGVGYTILDCKTNKVKQYLTFENYNKQEKESYEYDRLKILAGEITVLEKFEDFSPEEREIFINLKKESIKKE